MLWTTLLRTAATALAAALLGLLAPLTHHLPPSAPPARVDPASRPSGRSPSDPPARPARVAPGPATRTRAAQPVGPAPTLPLAVADILSAQLPDGAIAEYGTTIDPSRVASVQPYWANLAVIGLAAWLHRHPDPTVTADAWRWLAWYRAHMAPGTGYVADYRVSDGQLTDTGTEDSTDAYAGTFLSALAAMTAAGHERWPARSYESAAGEAVHAITTTLTPDGLTDAKPGYPMPYAMDNAEVQAGLAAAVSYARGVGDLRLRVQAAAVLARVRSGLENLWNPEQRTYDWASGYPSRLTVAYPDGWAQLWVVGWKAGMPRSRAVGLVDRYLSAQGVQASTTPLLGWAELAVGQRQRADRTAAVLDRALPANLRSSTWTVGSDGELLGLVAGLG